MIGLCWILGSGKPLRFEHWGAHEELSLSSSLAQRSQGLAPRTQRTRDTSVYTGLGHRVGVIPYSSVVWWIAYWAEDEQLQRKNSLLRGGVLVLGELVWLRMIWMICSFSAPLLRWWLVLFIEALVLFPNVRQEGIPQRPSLKGDN